MGHSNGRRTSAPHLSRRRAPMTNGCAANWNRCWSTTGPSSVWEGVHKAPLFRTVAGARHVLAALVQHRSERPPDACRRDSRTAGRLPGRRMDSRAPRRQGQRLPNRGEIHPPHSRTWPRVWRERFAGWRPMRVDLGRISAAGGNCGQRAGFIGAGLSSFSPRCDVRGHETTRRGRGGTEKAAISLGFGPLPVVMIDRI